MQASPVPSSIVTQVERRRPATTAVDPPGRPATVEPGRLLAFHRLLAEAATREEIHDALLAEVQERTGAERVLIQPRCGPRRIRTTARADGRDDQGDGLTLPVQFRGERFGTLAIPGPRARKLPAATVEQLALLCELAAAAERALIAERSLRCSDPAGSGRIHPPGLLLPFLRQLVSLARRRREPVSVLAIGAIREAVDPLVGVVLEVVRESDLLVREGERTLIAVLPNASAVHAPQIAEAVLRAVAEDEGPAATLADRLSIGVAVFPDAVRDGVGLLDLALGSLREAQRLGRRVEVAAPVADSPTVVWGEEPAGRAQRVG